jgi:leader peptidase (prepilin peptidase)/N-methyltransferase
MTPAFVLLSLGLAGLAVGSFLNVCILRLPRGESVVFPPSRCPSCGQQLRWWHNIPVVSWIALRGRCAFCATRILVRYPLVEALTAVLFVAHGAVFGPGLLLAARLTLAAVLIVLAFIDLDHRMLPNSLTLPFIVVGLAFSAVVPPGLPAALLGVALGGGLLWLIGEAYYRLRGVEGMGMGDVKMLAMIGAFLGWQGTLVTLIVATLAGAFVGLLMMATRRGGMRYALPFGTFLALGGIAASLFGDALLGWYLSFYP